MKKKNRLNKRTLARRISQHGGMKIEEAEKLLDCLIEVFRRAMESDEEIILQHMGTFSITERGERMGFNPSSGENVVLQPRRRVKFVASSTLRIGNPE